MLNIIAEKGKVHIDLSGDIPTIFLELKGACLSVLYEITKGSDVIEFNDMVLMFEQYMLEDVDDVIFKDTKVKPVVN